MKERPILFSAPMVRAILDGRKTQTRRIINPQPYIDEIGNFCWNGGNFGQDFNGPRIQAIASPIPSSKTKRVRCPYGKPGDRLWVKENWKTIRTLDNCKPSNLVCGTGIEYVAGGTNLASGNRLENTGKLRPSIFMPRWASRILLEVTNVRVERLQDISEEDAIAEGATRSDEYTGCADDIDSCVHAYKIIWESLNGPGSWDLNPFVWCIEFKRVNNDTRTNSPR